MKESTPSEARRDCRCSLLLQPFALGPVALELHPQAVHRAITPGEEPGDLVDVEDGPILEMLWNTRFQVRALEVDASSGQANGDLPRLREELEKRITRIGFRVVGFVGVEGTGSAPLQPEAEQANVFLTCRMSLEEIPRDFEGHFFRWQGAYEVTGAPPHGAVIMASQAAGGESFRTRSTARMRALTKGAEQLAGELETQISRYLGEDAGH